MVRDAELDGHCTFLGLHYTKLPFRPPMLPEKASICSLACLLTLAELPEGRHHPVRSPSKTDDHTPRCKERGRGYMRVFKVLSALRLFHKARDP